MQPYSEYKESGVEWLGGIPAEWDLLPMFTVARESKLSNKGMVEDNLLSLSYGRIKRKDIETLGGLLPESFETYQVVNENDQIFRLTDLQNDKRSLRTAICTERGIITSAYVAVTPFKIDPRFYSYLMRAYDENKVFYNLGSGMRQSLKYDELKRLPLVVPPNEVQQQIVAFLDRETARIDNLIAEKQNFINLLKEKRQALISHVVTKGLDPKVKMKDSGVEWIGEVPEHWLVGALGYYSTLNTGATPDRKNEGYWGGDIPWIKTGEVRYNTIFDTEEKITQEGFRNASVKLSPPGTVIMAMYGQGVTRGRVAILGVEATYNQACVAIHPSTKVVNVYLTYVLMAAYNFIRNFGNETSQTNLNAELVSKIKIVVPPVCEQLKIHKYLDEGLVKFNELESETEQSIALLKEHRTALISAAVTGKIDVRNQA